MECKSLGGSQIKFLGTEKSSSKPLRDETSKTKAKPFYGVADMAKEWGDLAHHKERVEHIKEQKIYESRNGSPIQIKGGALKLSNNPPPCRDYVIHPSNTSSNNSKNLTLKKNAKPNEAAAAINQQRSRTPIGAGRIGTERNHEAIMELQSRIKQLEGVVRKLRRENEEYVRKIDVITDDNDKLKAALHDSVKICKEYAEENDALREQLLTKPKVPSPPAKTPPSTKKLEQSQSSSQKKGGGGSSTKPKGGDFTNRSITQLLESIGTTNNKKTAPNSASKQQVLDQAISSTKIVVAPENQETECKFLLLINE